MPSNSYVRIEIMKTANILKIFYYAKIFEKFTKILNYQH